MVELQGMSSASPLAALAAMGLMRVLGEDRGLSVAMAWRSGVAAVEGITREAIIDELIDGMKARAEAPEFNWSDTPRNVSSETYRLHVDSMRADSRALAFMGAWATDAVLREDRVRPTRLDLTSGQQKLIADLRKLATHFNEEHFARSAFEAALFGGSYQEQHSFGWDPAAVRRHAYEPYSPGRKRAGQKGPQGKPGLIWLAVEALPLHPVVAVSPTRALTTGCRDNKAFVWPIWETFLELEEIRLLRMLPVEFLHERPGVTEIWCSQFGQSGKYGTLLPAVREH